MPYKREGSPNYYCRRRRLPGYGDTGRLSSRTTSKKIARDMERLVEDLARRALLDPTWYELLDAVCRHGTVTLPELLRAKNEGRLEALKQSLHDPSLGDAIEQFEAATHVKRQLKHGLDLLEEYAPPKARLGDLSPQVITRMCRRAEKDGRKRNSVRRMLLRAISMLLRFHLGNAERDRIFADVQFSAEDDTREVHLLPAEIDGLLKACEELVYGELSVVVRLALQTSADRGVLLAGKNADGRKRGLRVRDVRVYRDNETGLYSGEVYLPDTKTKDRTRTVPLTDGLCRELLVLARAKEPDDPVFSISYSQLDYLWNRVRKKAGLTHVRFKDLRAQVSIYGEEAGIPQTVLGRTMGHGDEAMTRRYQSRATAMSVEQAEMLERAMLGEVGKNASRADRRSEISGTQPSTQSAG